jgi:diguanylate cyclase (GGDEF)-like protein
MILQFARPKLNDETGRLAALYRYEILDTVPEREFDAIIRLVKRVFGVPMAGISFVSEERQWFKAATGLNVSESPRSTAFCQHTIQRTSAFAVENAVVHPLFAKHPLVTGEVGIRCYLGVPLTTPEGYNVGSLCLFGTEARSFSEEDTATLEIFGQLVISQLELRMLARRDSLTGALTRRAFEDSAGQAMKVRAGTPAVGALILFDLDHFKFVNDRFGHSVGDEVIKAVAEIITTELRPEDRFGRFGGEEFSVLVREDGADGACKLAERVRAKLAGLRLPGLGGHRVTVSAGVAPRQPNQVSLEAWIASADVALYAAKRGGRDQVIVAA